PSCILTLVLKTRVPAGAGNTHMNAQFIALPAEMYSSLDMTWLPVSSKISTDKPATEPGAGETALSRAVPINTIKPDLGISTVTLSRSAYWLGATSRWFSKGSANGSLI